MGGDGEGHLVPLHAVSGSARRLRDSATGRHGSTRRGGSSATPTKVGDFYNWSIDELMLAAELGFDGLGTNEHHQNPYGFMCNPNLFGADPGEDDARPGLDDVALVQLGATLAATSPPIRIAEEYAVLDCISGGRLVAGLPLGLGCDADISATASRRSSSASAGARRIELMLKAWTAKEFFAWNGKYYQLPQVNLWPRPVQDPHPPLLVPGARSSSTWDYCHERDCPYAFLSYFGGKSATERSWTASGSAPTRNGRDRNPYRAVVPAARRRRRHRRAGRGAVRRARRVLLQQAPALAAAVPRAARLQRLQEPPECPQADDARSSPTCRRPQAANGEGHDRARVRRRRQPGDGARAARGDGEAPERRAPHGVLQFGSMPHELADARTSTCSGARSCRTCRTSGTTRAGRTTWWPKKLGATPVRDVAGGGV